MFRGNNPARVDEKGRLKLPAEFKRRIDEVYGNQFFITSRDGKVAQIYPMREWERVEAKLALMPNSDPAKKKLMLRINYFGQTAEMDTQGRLLLPQILRETAKLTTDVSVFGMHKYLEIHNSDAVVEEIANEPITPDDDKALAAFGL